MKYLGFQAGTKFTSLLEVYPSTILLKYEQKPFAYISQKFCANCNYISITQSFTLILFIWKNLFKSYIPTFSKSLDINILAWMGHCLDMVSMWSVWTGVITKKIKHLHQTDKCL
jgi:hypothetical protein